jgi:lipid-A-disaccharide synthase
MSRDNAAIGMVAGEPSGDLLASTVIAGLRERAGDVSIAGIGGPRMESQGFDAWYPMSKLAVFGYVEALRHYREIVGIRNAARDRWLAAPPSVFVGVDAPDFNFGLEASLRASGIPTVHFVSPSIWAWRGERIHKIKRAVSRMLVLLPFEEKIYQDAGIPVSYVGHPLASTIPRDPDRAAARAKLGLSDSDRVLALMPGSRRGELRHLVPRFLEAARLLRVRDPALKVLVPMVNAERQAQFDALAATLPQRVDVQCVAGGTHDILAACDAALVASGTATLETALFKRPMVIAYAVGRVSWWLLKNKGYLPWVGLPNVLANRFVVPELIQDAATPQALAEQTWKALTDDAHAEALRQRFTVLHDDLRRDTAALAADAILATAQAKA